MQEEKYNTRDRTYSAWHRRNSTRRFIGIEKAQTLAMIDMDAALYVEYDDSNKEPLALIETAIDVGQQWKTSTVTENLARKAKIPAFVLLYKISHDATNPADVRFRDIESFRVRMIYPTKQSSWKTMSPKEWSDALVRIRTRECSELDKKFHAMAAANA